jgi:short subunit dehydrogenase-like uncharacterized protein
MGRQYDIIVFGASGYTGKFCVEEIVKRKKMNPADKFTWAISGRSESKLDEILAEVSNATGEDLSEVPKIIADVSDFESLKGMAAACSVVMNAVGPYEFWGEQVIKACISEGTHHVDLSGEPQFLERVELLHHKEAEKNNSYIVGACGFDSIPADCGVELLRKKFPGDVNSVESYLHFDTLGKSKVNYGTWYSAVNALHRVRELEALQRKLYPEPLPKPKYKLKPKPIHFGEEVQGWSFMMPFPDARIIDRTQKYLYFKEKLRPIQAACYAKTPLWVYTFIFWIGSIVLGILAQFKFVLNLLEKHPKLFTMGTFSAPGANPNTREEMNRIKFTFTLVAHGWQDKLTEPTDQHTTPPDTKMILRVKGKNPGYGATCILFLQAALTILRESDRLPSTGGVYTPGVAFRNTSLIDQLNKYNVTFTIEK